MEELIDLQSKVVLKDDVFELPQDGTSLDFLRMVYRCSALPLSTRMRAAAIAIQFECPKLGVQVNIEGGADMAQRLERAIARSGQAKSNGQLPKLLPAPSIRRRI